MIRTLSGRKKSLPTLHHKKCLLILLKWFIVLAFVFKSMDTSEANVLCLHFFFAQTVIQFSQNRLLNKTILPTPLNFSVPFVESLFTLQMSVYFQTSLFCFIDLSACPFVNTTSFWLLLYILKSGRLESLPTLFFFFFSQKNCFCYSSCFVFPHVLLESVSTKTPLKILI